MIKNIFKTPSAKQIAQRELEEAERALVKAETNALYHNKMAEYHKAQIETLRRHVRSQPEEMVA